MFHNRKTSYLGDPNTVDPLLEGPDIITAEVLDVLRLLLDLPMLHTHTHTLYITLQDTLFTSSLITTTFGITTSTNTTTTVTFAATNTLEILTLIYLLFKIKIKPLHY